MDIPDSMSGPTSAGRPGRTVPECSRQSPVTRSTSHHNTKVLVLVYSYTRHQRVAIVGTHARIAFEHDLAAPDADDAADRCGAHIIVLADG